MDVKATEGMAFDIYKTKRPLLEAHLNFELGKWDLSLNDSWVTCRFFDFLMDNFWVSVTNALKEAGLRSELAAAKLTLPTDEK